MIYTKTKNISFLISALLHLFILLLFFFIKFTIDYGPAEYVEIGFGNLGVAGSSGAEGSQLKEVDQVEQMQENNNSESSEEVKEVDLPQSKNTEESNVIQKDNKTDVAQNTKSNSTAENAIDNSTSESIGNKTEGDGSFGYDIDWGGQGTRRIYNYILPTYPEGVNKEIDIKLRFTILPDGTVGNITPLFKADTKLEMAAITSLRKWRFEPLKSNQRQGNQNAVIIFPYRLQ